MSWWLDPDPIVVVEQQARVLVMRGYETFEALKIAARLWEKVARDLTDPDACWFWTGSCDSGGRASFQLGRTINACRFVHEVTNGGGGPGLFACHTCDQPACVRPEHLWWGTPKQNSDDKILKRRDDGPSRRNRDKETCDSGHMLVGDNVGVNNRGQRFCRTCARAARRAYYDRTYVPKSGVRRMTRTSTGRG